jgi:hypothetical protein
MTFIRSSSLFRPGQTNIQWDSLNQLHDQERLGGLEQHGLLDLQIEGSAEVGMGKLLGEVELGLHLLDEADVLLLVADNVL